MFLTLAGKRPSRVLEKAIHREVSRQMKDFLRWYTGWECELAEVEFHGIL